MLKWVNYQTTPNITGSLVKHSLIQGIGCEFFRVQSTLYKLISLTRKCPFWLDTRKYLSERDLFIY